METVGPTVAADQKAPVGNGRSRSNPITGCPLTAALAAVGGKWKLVIVYALRNSPRHFAALREHIPDISPKVLTEQLRELVADDIVARRPSGRTPAPVVYSLSEYGRSVLPIMEAVLQWGNGHLARRQERSNTWPALAGQVHPDAAG
jgi:DNA-binding HxlR family transcriptional regulator